MATYEAGSPYEIKLVRDGDEWQGKTRLETVGLFTPKSKQNAASFNHWLHNFTAHSKSCPVTVSNAPNLCLYDGWIDSYSFVLCVSLSFFRYQKEELLFISYDLIGSKFHVGVMSDEDELLSMETFNYPNGEASMMHDFAITESKIIIMCHPLLFNLEQSMQGGLPFTYSTTHSSFFGVIERRRNANGEGGGCGSEIQWIEAENGYCYHSMAAYDDAESEGLVHLFAQKLAATGALGMATFKEDGRQLENYEVQELAKLHKWTLDTVKKGEGKGKILESSVQCEVPSDFPEINPQYVGRKCRFGYSQQISSAFDAGGGVPLFNKLLKHDLHSKTFEALDLGGKVGGDMVFVPDASRSGQEDGGWILYFTHDVEDETRCWLEVVDAEDITAGPMAMVELPFIPIGFHGKSGSRFLLLLLLLLPPSLGLAN